MTAPKTIEQATVEVAREILADQDWTARVVIAAIVAEHELSRIKDVVVSGHQVFARVTLSKALTR